MNLTPSIKGKIQELYDNTPESVHGVSLGYKYKNGQKTDKISIVFYVDKKLPPQQIPEGEMLPSVFEIGGDLIEADVQEKLRANLLECYTAGDANISRLQPFSTGQAMLAPMRGGQEIVQFPTSWSPANGGGYTASVGTLGFFCVDDVDGKTVGVTNAHVAVNNYRFCSERSPDGYNTYDPITWSVNTGLGGFHPGAASLNSGNLVLVASNFQATPGGRIKRYSGFSTSRTNYVDVAVLMMNPAIGGLMDANSYKMWGPIGVDPFANPMPFATTSEIDSLLITNPRLFSTGRSSGPKGFTDVPSCNLRTFSVGLSATVDGRPCGDTIIFGYEDESNNPLIAGDSGSALVALMGSTYKIVGLAFAGPGAGGSYGIACRIDRVAQEMKLRAWTAGSLNTVPNDALGTMVIPADDPRASQTSFVHTDGHTYWQAGFRA